MADEGNIFSEKAVDMAKKISREFKNITSGMKRTIRAADDLQSRLEKMAKDSDMSEQWNKTGDALGELVDGSKEQLEVMERIGATNNTHFKQMQRRINHSKVILNMMGKQSKFNVARFKINKAMLGLRTRLGLTADEQLTAAYKAADMERKKAKAAEDHVSLTTRGKDALKSQLKKYLGIGAILASIGKMLTSSSGRITDLGSAFGVMGAQSGSFREALLDSNYAAVGIGKSLSDITSLSDTLASDFGISATEAASLSDQILNSATAIGLSTEEGAKLFGMLIKIGGMTAKSAEDFAEQTYQIAKTNDILPSTVMKDIAGFSGAMATSAGLNFKNLARGAIEARKMGITLSDIVTSTDALMNIQQSLQTQRTTELIVGEKFNLSRLRSLKLADDTAGIAREIQHILKDSTKFETANFYQRKAYTRLFGMEFDQLVKIRRGQSGLLKETKTFADLLGKDTLGAWEKIKAAIARVGITLSETFGVPLNNLLGQLEKAISSQGAMDKFNSAAKKIQTVFNDWLGGNNANQLDKMMTAMSSMAASMGSIASQAAQIQETGFLRFMFGGGASPQTAIGGAGNFATQDDGPIGVGPKVLVTPQGITRFADNDIGYMMKKGAGAGSAPPAPTGPTESAKTNELLTTIIAQNNRIHGPGGYAYTQGMKVVS